MLLPTGDGILHIYERRYLDMFRNVQMNTPEGSPLLFGHVLTAHAVPAQVRDRVGPGIPRIACAARVLSMEPAGERGDGMLVRYEALRRIKIAHVEEVQGEDGEGYLSAACEWMDDARVDPGPAQGVSVDTGFKRLTADEQQRTDLLEAQLWANLQHLRRLSAQSGSEDASLPLAVQRFAPPATVSGDAGERIANALEAKGNMGAAFAIRTWRRASGIDAGNGAEKPREVANPYSAAVEVTPMAKGRRQELFSFASAQMVDIGAEERSLLLHLQSTAQRLEWALEAVVPHVSDLERRAAARKAVDS
ncbi:unnamed protein product [Pedinophyceae sp. YPF-701]|nr:unnamed protein product [Pedinophyceae sp. YPF-701]